MNNKQVNINTLYVISLIVLGINWHRDYKK